MNILTFAFLPYSVGSVRQLDKSGLLMIFRLWRREAGSLDTYPPRPAFDGARFIAVIAALLFVQRFARIFSLRDCPSDSRSQLDKSNRETRSFAKEVTQPA